MEFLNAGEIAGEVGGCGGGPGDIGDGLDDGRGKGTALLGVDEGIDEVEDIDGLMPAVLVEPQGGGVDTLVEGEVEVGWGEVGVYGSLEEGFWVFEEAAEEGELDLGVGSCGLVVSVRIVGGSCAFLWWRVASCVPSRYSPALVMA